MIRPQTSFERLLLTAFLVALMLGLALVASARAPLANLSSNETPVASHIDHVVVYEQGAQVERLADVSLDAGTNMLVFTDLNTAIDPSKIRLSGRGDFTVLGMSHRYHTDTLGGRRLQRGTRPTLQPSEPTEQRHSTRPNPQNALRPRRTTSASKPGLQGERHRRRFATPDGSHRFFRSALSNHPRRPRAHRP